MKKYKNKTSILLLSTALMSFSLASETNTNITNDGIGETYISGHSFNDKKIIYSIKDDLAVFEGDIILGTVDKAEYWRTMHENHQSQHTQRSVIIPGNRFRWENGVLPYEIAANVSPDTRNIITRAIAHWEARTSIRFVLRTSANANQYSDYVRVVSDSQSCSSRVGRIGGGQRLNVVRGCGLGGIIHEFGHALGLWHEQSREDRNQFIRINTENIRDGLAYNFNQHIYDGNDVGPYDYGSIMHYGAYDFSKNNKPTITVLTPGKTIGQRRRLSEGDISSIEQMYGTSPTTNPTNPTTNPTTPTIALNTIVSNTWDSNTESNHRTGRYAKFYTFTLTQSTNVTIDLDSSKDTYLYLLQGNNANGSPIKEDDDGGRGRSSRITDTLPAGTYTIEATTYRKSTSGSFNLRVNTLTEIPTIPLNTTVNNTWDSNTESKHRPGRYAKFYIFTLTQSTNITIDLASSKDTYLYLFQGNNANGSPIKEDDDGGRGRSSRITDTLPAGTYTIEATTYRRSTSGSFILRVSR